MADFREFTAKTVSDCITDACMTFSVTSDRLEYEVVSEGSSGFIGLGVKPATIKARVKEESFEDLEKNRADEAQAEKAAVLEKARKAEEERKAAAEAERKANEERAAKLKEQGIISDEPTEDKRERRDRGRGRNDRSDRRTDRRNNKGRDNYRSNYREDERFEEEVQEPVVVEKKEIVPVPEELKPTLITEADKFLKEVFLAMGIKAEVTCAFDEEDVLTIEVNGEDMGVLIGKRGQTLDSLQYLVSLVVNKYSENYVRVKVDTENYRERRKETLESLARNIAFKVKRTRRSVALEPMNPYERRIIHSALQNDRYVTTHSEGEDPYRKVVISLKNNRR